MRKHATPIQPPAADLRFLSDGEHYEEVVERMRSVKRPFLGGRHGRAGVRCGLDGSSLSKLPPTRLLQRPDFVDYARKNFR